MDTRVYVNDLLSESYHVFGNSAVGAEAAFESIENATKQVCIDISIAALLTPQTRKKGCCTAACLDGKQTFAWKDGMLVPQFGRIDVEIPPAYRGDMRSMLVDGGPAGTRTSLTNPYTYMMSSNAFYQLGRMLKIGYTGQWAGIFMRDFAFAERCTALDDETPVHIMYREQDGIKKVYGCFSEKRTYPIFKEICDAMKEASAVSGEEYYLAEWDINQKTRSALFAGLEDSNKSLKFTWADCIARVPSIVKGGIRVKVENMANLAKEATALITA